MIVYLHGLESSAQGRKATWLRGRYESRCPELNTALMIQLRDDALAGTWTWDPTDLRMRAALEPPLLQAQAAIETTLQPKLVIGSSFGGALLLELMHRGVWSGPSLFLAQAGLRVTQRTSIPPKSRALLIHGRQDTVIPFGDSERLSNGGQFPLWTVDDDHMLRSILVDGTLARAIDGLLDPRDPPGSI